MKSTVLQFAGLGVISVAFGLMWLPLGLLAAGVCLVLVGLAWERVDNAQSPIE